MRYLSLIVFTAGAVTLGMELSAARLLEPALGTNQLLWATLIGLILFYLAIGSWLGGRLADRYPTRAAFDTTLTAAALAVAVVPLISGPVLRFAAIGMAGLDVGLLAPALVAILLLFSVPGVLLGTTGPWAIRLALADTTHSGAVAGRLYALGSAGSILGTFLPALWLIPTFGTRWTFYLLALSLLLVLAVGAIRHPHRWIPLGGLMLVTTLLWFQPPGHAIRQTWDASRSGQIIYEDESRYNYIAVRQWNSERHLELNDGVGIHSVYHPESSLSLGIWDYFLVAPYFSRSALDVLDQGTLVIGLAAGTVPQLLTEFYGPRPITGVELDPQIIQVGRDYFAMTQPNLTAVADDGRRWLTAQPTTATWGLIAVDAYRPPYIPFHLTTVEFFQLVADHLADDGIVAVNVGRTATNFALVDALTTTMGEVFPAIFVIDEPGPADTLGNSLVVASKQPLALETFAANLATLPTDEFPPEYVDFVQRALTQTRVAAVTPDGPIFTDDRANVEQIVHRIIVDYLRN